MLPAELGFPSDRFPSFRSEVRQWETICELAGSGVRFDMLQAPTGAGKSLLYNALGLFLGLRYCILTGTKQLQDQNTDSFASVGLVDVRGHGNYPCALRDRSPYEPVCARPRLCCEWQAAIDHARGRNVVTNYAFWMSAGAMLGEFDLLILDEAHGAMEWLTDAVSVTVRPRDLHELTGRTLPALDIGLDIGYRFATWAEETLAAAREARRSMRAPRPDDREGMRRLAHLDGLIEDMARLAAAPRSGTPWVIDHEGDGGGGLPLGVDPGLVFKPVWPAAYAEAKLFRGIENVLLTSATLSPAVGRHLGIPADDSAWHEIESGFEARRRPIWYMPVAKMEYAMGAADLKRAVTSGDLFMGTRIADRKGLIQVPSYDWCDRIAAESRYARYFLRHGRRQHGQALEEFTRASPPAVLLSPAIKEGWDGKDDLARWSWVPKVPLLNRRIPLTKARCSLDSTWHDIEVATSIMQWAGRIVRSAKDWGEVLVTDKHFGWLLAKKELWPRGFLAAVRKVGDVPPRLEMS